MLYRYWRRTSPNLDRLADEGIPFESFIGQCAHTVPSFTGMMTGKTPFETGAVTTLHCVPDSLSARLPDRTPVLAELLAKVGVHTYAVNGLMNFACHASWSARVRWVIETTAWVTANGPAVSGRLTIRRTWK